MAIHGNKSQNARQLALSSFKSGKIRVIVATDIAARGIDVQNLGVVVNYDMPDVAETYVHRIGRTGRAGSRGIRSLFLLAGRAGNGTEYPEIDSRQTRCRIGVNIDKRYTFGFLFNVFLI